VPISITTDDGINADSELQEIVARSIGTVYREVAESQEVSQIPRETPMEIRDAFLSIYIII
jgi:hypothetical protein